MLSSLDALGLKAQSQAHKKRAQAAPPVAVKLPTEGEEGREEGRERNPLHTGAKRLCALYISFYSVLSLDSAEFQGSAPTYTQSMGPLALPKGFEVYGQVVWVPLG